MAGSVTSSAAAAKRRGGARSVSGCLTCRRRRVKCNVQKAPCDNCKRLELTCTPSFHSNFKNWTSSGLGSPRSTSTGDTRLSPAITEKWATVQNTPLVDDIETASDLPNDVVLWLSKGVGSGHFSGPDTLIDEGIVEEVPREETTIHSNLGGMDTSSQRNLSSIDSNDLNFFESHNLSITFGHLNRNQTPLSSFESTSMRSHSTPLTLPSSSDEPVMELGDSDIVANSFNDFSWSIPPQMSHVYGNSHGHMPFLDQYEIHMPNLLTSKKSPWNPYNYMLKSTQGFPDSPLRHGILSWTCSYMSSEEQNPSYSSALYYVSASTAVRRILAELSTGQETLIPMRRNGNPAEKIYLLLSTSFFLSHCDLMLCDYASFYERLDGIKRLFETQWSNFKSSLGSLERRLLIWLAYLDLRSSMFGEQRLIGSGPQGLQKDLLRTLKDLNAFPLLRGSKKGHSYLSECFGENYPASEIEEDLLQEPCHIKCDDVLSILISINAFDTWNDEVSHLIHTDSMVRGLRGARIQALRADIARIRAVSCSAPLHYAYFCQHLHRSVPFYSATGPTPDPRSLTAPHSTT